MTYVPPRLVTLDNFPFEYSEDDVGNDAENDFANGGNSEMIDDISFHCSSCSYQTKIESLYDRHVAKHALVAPYLCSSCTYSDFDHGSFVDHMTTHQQGRSLRCNFCNYRSVPTSMKVHLLKHRTVDIIDCSMCEFSTNYRTAMKSHVEVYHNREHVCNYCQNVMSKYSLIKHSWNAHGVVVKTKLKSLNELGYGIEEESVNDEQKTKSEFDAHVKSETDFDSDTKEEFPDQDDVSLLNTKTVQAKYDGKWIGKFDCEFCDFTTKYFYSKKFHVEKFHVKQFTCGHCDSVMTKHDLAAHYKDVHGQDINLKHCRRFAEVSSDPRNLVSAKCSGPSIIEAVKSASRKRRKKFGGDEVKKPATEAQLSTPDVPIANSPSKPKIQEMGDEPSSSGCEPVAPFVLSIAEAVKSKSRKAKRKNSLAPSVPPQSETLCLKPSGPQTRDIGTAIEDHSFVQEVPSLEPEVHCVPEAENRKGYLCCSKCQYRTKWKSLMRRHAVSHLPEGHLFCSKCNFSSDINYEFARHLKSHSDGDMVPCCFCSYTVAFKALGNLSNHLGIHKKFGTFFCSRCNYSSAVRKPLKDHIQWHHSKKHRCPECPQVGTKFKILKHTKECHPGIENKPINVDVPKMKMKNKDENLPVDGQTEGGIGIIGTNEGNTSSDISHPTSDIGNPTPDIGSPTSDVKTPTSCAQIASASIGFPVLGTSNRQTDPDNQLQCRDQASSLSASSTLPVDLKPGRLYCSDCPYNTKKKPLLRRHVAKHLLDGSFFTCPVCRSKDNNPYEFVLHLKSHELNLMSCCFCSYGFRSTKGILATYASHLELHRPIHFVDCPNCERTFKRIYELRKHFYTNHVRKRRCPECNKSMTRYKLHRHITIKHKPYKNIPVCRSQAGSAVPKTSDPRHFGANSIEPGTSTDGFVDGAVGESFGVPLSPKLYQNSGLPSECCNLLNWNAQKSHGINENQVLTTQPGNIFYSEYVSNSMDNYAVTEFEDPTNVPIFDISEASLNRSSVASTRNFAVSPNQNRKNTKPDRVPMLWDSLGIKVFDFFQNPKNVESDGEPGSEDTATGDESLQVGDTTLSDIQIPHFLDHNYAAQPNVRRKECKRLVTLDVNPFDTDEVQYDAEFESFEELNESQRHDVMSMPVANSTKNKVFQCDKCTFQTQCQELFDRHVARHSTDRPFECTICDYSVLDHSRFVGHLVFHQQSKVIQCPFCPYASYAPTMKLHMLKHRAMEIFDCSACEFSSNNAKSLKLHAEVYHSQQFKCEYCKKRMTKHSLIEHWDEVHGIREVSMENAKQPGTRLNNAASSNPGSSCSILYPAVVLKTEEAQCEDERIMNSANTRGLDLAESGESETSEFADDEIDRTYACPVCEFSSHLKVLLKYHILCMHTEKLSCKHCSAEMTKHALIQHSKNAHGIYIYFDGKGLQKANSQSKKPEHSPAHSEDHPKSKNLVRNPKKREVPAKILRSADKLICSICKFCSFQKSNVESHIDNLHRRRFFCNNCPAIMTKYALIKHSALKHGVTLKLKNRYITEAKPGTHSRPSLESDSEESDKNSEGNPGRDTVRSKSMPVDVNNYIMKKGDQFVCSICEYSVTTYRAMLEKHIEKIHMKKYYCKHCPEIMSKHDLIEHSIAMHGITLSIKSKGLKEVREDVDDTSQGMDDHGPDDTELFDYDENCPTLIHTGTSRDRSYVAGGIKARKPFACSICDFSSHNEWSLTCHMKFLHAVKYHCNHCPAVMTKHDIVKHSFSEHGVEIRPRGPSGLREAREDLESQDIQNFPGAGDMMFAPDHFMGHFLDDTLDRSMPNMQNCTMKTNYPSSCAICGFAAKSNWYLTKHMDSLHSKKFRCPHCPAVMTKHELIDHGWSAHGVTIKAKNRFLEEVAQDSDSDSSDSDDEMDHSDCGDPEYYPDESSFQDKSTSKKPCPFCEYTAQDVKMKLHVERMHTEKYCCEHCPVVLPKYDLIRHYKNEHSIVTPTIYRGYRFRKAIEQGNDGQALGNQAVKIEPGQNVTGSSTSQNKSALSTSRKGCSFCGYNSVVPKDVMIHEERMHRLKFHCDRCPLVMVKYDLLRHNKVKHGVVLPNNHRFKEAKKVRGQGVDNQTEAILSDEEYSEFQVPSFQGNSFTKKCPFCGQAGASDWHVQIHVERMHTKKYRCKHCTAVMTKYDLFQHYKNLHGITILNGGKGLHFVEADMEEVTGRQSGNQVIDSARLPSTENQSRGTKEHSRSQISTEAGSYNCSICDFSTKKEIYLVLHVENWHKRKYVCNDCPQVMTKHEIIGHSKDVHGVTIPRSGRPSQTIRLAEPDPVEQIVPKNHKSGGLQQTGSGFKVDATGETFKCNVCDFSSAHKKSMLLHVINMHRKKYSCDECSVVLTKYDLIVHSEDVHGVKIPWNGRGYVLKRVTQEGLNDESQTGESSHMLSLNGEISEKNAERETYKFSGPDATGKFKCSNCEFTSLYPYNVKYHVENMHIKLYCCNNCSAIKSKYDLIQHYENEHNVTISSYGKGFKEYRLGAQQADTTGSELYDCPMETDQHGSMGAVDESDESEFIHSVGVRPRSTLKPDISEEQTDNHEQFIRVEGNGEMFSCSICGFPSKYRPNLLTHFKGLHSKKFSCGSCSAVMTKYELIQHYKSVHDVTILNNGRGFRGFKEVSEGSEQTDDTDVEYEFSSSVGACPRSTAAPEIGHEGANEQDDYVTVEKNGDDFICSCCGWSSKYKWSVQSHLDSMHSKKYGCKHCSVVLSKYDLIQHYRDLHNIVIPNLGRGHTGEFFQDVSQVSESASLNATTDVDGDDENENVIKIGDEFKCAVCDHSSTWKSCVKSHFLSLHKKQYSCTLCPVIMTKYEMIQHYEINHDVVIDRLGRGHYGKFFKEVNPVSEGTSESADMSGCSIQDGRLSGGMHTDGDNESMTIIQEGGEFKCSICGFSTAFKFNLKSHFECFHRKKYSCNRCSFVTTKYGMVCHYENTHRFVIPNLGKGNLAPYCKAVSESEFSEVMESSVFADSMVETVMDDPLTDEIDGDFDMNKAIIRQGEEFKCSICCHSSVWRKNIRVHVEALHKKKYSCNRCSLVTTKYDMIRHYETEHDLVIAHLGRGLRGAYFKAVDESSGGVDSLKFADDVAESSSLDDHWIAETDDGNGMDGTDGDSGMDIIQKGGGFHCSVCGHTTALKCNLNVHVEVMHKKKYSCNRCSVVLTKYEMIQHYETKHQVEIEKSGKGSKSQYFKEVGHGPEASDAPGGSAMDDNEFRNADESVASISEAGEFKCSICDYFSDRRPNLVLHLDSHHKKKYSCNRCSAVMTKYEMVKHYETEHAVVIQSQGRGPGGYMAQYCKAVSQPPEVTNSTVLAHNEPENHGAEVGHLTSESVTDAGDHNHNGFIFKDGEEFRCSICDYSSPSKSVSEKHLGSLHNKKFSCNRCSVVMTKYDMMQHFENDHGVEIPNKGRGVTTQYFTAVVGQDSNVTVAGLSEFQHTSGKSTLEIETDIPLAKFQGTDEFKCTFCDFSSKWKKCMMNHIENMHTKKFTCNHCSVIMTKHEMIQHCENDHGIVVNKKTPTNHIHFVEASQMFDDPTSFAEGKPTTTDSAGKPALGSVGGNMGPSEDMNLMCSICDFSTKHSFSMEMHMANLHKKKYACDHCPAVFTKYCLIKHCKNVHGVTISRYNHNIREVKSATKGSANDNHDDIGLLTGSSAFEGNADVNLSSSDNQGPSLDSSNLVTGGLTMFSCSLCDYSSQLRIHLQVHKKNMHSTKHTCNLCSEVMTKHELLGHHRDIHGKVGSCNEDTKDSKPESCRRGYDENLDVAQDCTIVEPPGPSTSPVIDLTSSGQNQFSCTVCEFSSHVKVSLTTHMELLHTKKYHCSHCSAVMTKHELVSHCNNVHGVYIPIRGMSFQEANVDLESSSEYDDVSDADAMQARNTFSCTVCDFSSKVKWYLKDHMDKFHRRKYCCMHCPAVMTKYVLINHCKSVHGVAYSSRQPLSEAKDENSKSSPAEEICKIWNRQGSSTTSDITETSSVKSNNIKASDQENDRARCSKCDFSTPHKWYLKEHMESFHRKKYSCNVCLAVMTKFELFEHSKERHGVILKKLGRLPSASAKLSIENHAKSKYTSLPEFKKPKRFPCSMCSFSSFHPFGLKRHIKIHHTIKYSCQHCPVVMTRYALIKHSRIVHSARIPENSPDVPKSIDDVNSSESRHSGDHTYSLDYPASQVVNPKFQAQQQNALKSIHSPAFQPVVLLERLDIDIDDLDSTFSIVDNTNATDSAMLKNPKFHDLTYEHL